MRADAVSRRYARALFALADEQGRLEPVGSALTALARLLEEPALARVLKGPIARETKGDLVRRIADEAGAPAVLRDFLLVLVDHDRVQHLTGIASVYATLVDRRGGITRAKVRSAAPLAHDMVAALGRVFGSLTGKQVIPAVQVEPELIAGVIVELEGRVYDGSLRTQLGRLHQQMATGRRSSVRQ